MVHQAVAEVGALQEAVSQELAHEETRGNESQNRQRDMMRVLSTEQADNSKVAAGGGVAGGGKILGRFKRPTEGRSIDTSSPPPPPPSAEDEGQAGDVLCVGVDGEDMRNGLSRPDDGDEGGLGTGRGDGGRGDVRKENRQRGQGLEGEGGGNPVQNVSVSWTREGERE
jgi:hypothetical protein